MIKDPPKVAKLWVHMTESKQCEKHSRIQTTNDLSIIRKSVPFWLTYSAVWICFTYFSKNDLKRYDENISNSSVRFRNILSKFLGSNFDEIGSREIRFFPIFTATIKTITTTIKRANIRVYVWIIWKSVSSIIPEQIA